MSVLKMLHTYWSIETQQAGYIRVDSTHEYCESEPIAPRHYFDRLR